MAISDVAGPLKQFSSYLPTETFSGSCSYTSIPAASPNPDIKTEFMEHEQIIYLPDDMFPTRTAVSTADQELWITHGVFPIGTGKPFGQSTYTIINKATKNGTTKSFSNPTLPGTLPTSQRPPSPPSSPLMKLNRNPSLRLMVSMNMGRWEIITQPQCSCRVSKTATASASAVPDRGNMPPI